MKKYHSLRKKLLLLLVPPLLLLIFVASSILFRFAIVEQRDAFDNALYDSAYSIYQLLEKSETKIEAFSLPKIEKQFILNDQSDVIFYNVVDTDGNILNGEKKLTLIPEVIQPLKRVEIKSNLTRTHLEWIVNRKQVLWMIRMEKHSLIVIYWLGISLQRLNSLAH